MNLLTRFGFLAEIRIDQSHCNYHLANSLRDQGFEILFVDAGRATRGGTGSQGASLRVFEGNGLPIPDIVAINPEMLLFVEIDLALSRAISSFGRYRVAEKCVLQQFSCFAVGGRIPRLTLGFCQTGVVRCPERAAYTSLRECELDLFVHFNTPRTPVMRWS